MRDFSEAHNIFFLGDWEIKVGNGPDIILVETMRPELVPNFDIYPDIVYASNGYIVGMGKVLMENRQVPGEEEILRHTKKAAKALVER